MQVQWTVDVAKIKEAALRSASERVDILLRSTGSPPLGGITWEMNLSSCWDAEKSGSLMRLSSRCRNAPVGMCCSYAYELACGDFMHQSGGFVRGANNMGWGYDDCFDVGYMSGGWDDAVWSAKGLPLTGELTFTMRITAVAHAVQR